MRRCKLITEWAVEQLYRWAMFWERLAIAADRALLAYLLEKRRQRLDWQGCQVGMFLDGRPRIGDLPDTDEAGVGGC